MWPQESDLWTKDPGERYSEAMTIRKIQREIAGLSPAETTNTIIELLQGNPAFLKIARMEGELLVQRDREDEEKLQKGVEYSLKSGILKTSKNQNPWNQVDAKGKTPEEIYQEIRRALPEDLKGETLLVCGESGVGKGTLVSLMVDKNPEALQWSNGDIFRLYVYLLTALYPEKEKALTGLSQEEIQEVRRRISIEDNQVFYTWEGEKVPLNRVKNSDLKTSRINSLLPSFAYYLQGEVINFTNDYIHGNRTRFVILEGRKTTLDYIDSDSQFELIHSDKDLLGQRRAAQKVLALMEGKESSDVDIALFLEQYQ